MCENVIQAKISMLPESAKQEVLDFVEFLLSKYDTFPGKLALKKKNHKSEADNKYLRVEDVFKDVRGKVRYYDDILKPETEKVTRQ
jgi:hypothetical protein